MRMAPRYRRASKKEKSRIVDEYMAITGLKSRKYAIDPPPDPSTRKKRKPGHGGRKRIYGPKEEMALIGCWGVSHYSCSDNLKALMPLYIWILKVSGELILEPETEQKLLRMSRAQIDRLLRPHRQRLKIKKTQRRITKPGSIQERIKVRSGPWDNPPVGYTEIDLVHHGGSSSEGEYAQL
ncbi:MAG: hypothetical protein ABIM74_05860 [candidate division WOR-3 bacterium]